MRDELSLEILTPTRFERYVLNMHPNFGALLASYYGRRPSCAYARGTTTSAGTGAATRTASAAKTSL